MPKGTPYGEVQPGRIAATVIVSATVYFPEQARKIIAAVPVENQPATEWESMRRRHKLGDEQIIALWEWTRALKDTYDDMNFTPPSLARITAPTLIVYGDRDPLYPVEMAVDMYRAIPRSALWIVPNAGHGPIFFDAAPQFVQIALSLFRTQTGARRRAPVFCACRVYRRSGSGRGRRDCDCEEHCDTCEINFTGGSARTFG